MSWRHKLEWANIPDPTTEYRTNADIALEIARESFSRMMLILPVIADDIPWQTLPDEIRNSIDEEAITEIIRMKIAQWAEGIERGDIFAEH